MTTIQGKTPEEILVELEDGIPVIDIVENCVRVESGWLRSSMKSLLKGVMENIKEEKMVDSIGNSEAEESYNNAVDNCLAVIQSTIDSI